MTNLINRTGILFASRLFNIAIAFLSPVFLVRLLDVNSFGQYREFMLYSILLMSFFNLGQQGSLIYFIPRYPDEENVYITQTALYCLIGSILGVAAIVLFRPIILSKTSYDFVVPLAIYIFLSMNLSFWDSYNLGKKKVHLVLYYSTFFLMLRIVVLITVAYVTRRVEPIVYGLVVVEGVKTIFVLIYAIYKRWFTLKISLKSLIYQFKYFAPLGFSDVLKFSNQNISKLFVSTYLGVGSLAIYDIGSYKIPILNIVRSSVVDTIFPDVVERNKRDRSEGLKLWQKSNIVFCAVSFPIFAVFFYYADIFIIKVFTESYADAVPVFRVYLLIMLLGAFEVTVPLRSINQNMYFGKGSLIRLAVNLVLLVAFFDRWGLLGPVTALVLSEYVYNLYLARKLLIAYEIPLKALLMWDKHLKILFCTILSLPVLFLGEMFNLNDLIRSIGFSAAYLCSFSVLLYFMGVEEYVLLVNNYKRKILGGIKVTG